MEITWNKTDTTQQTLKRFLQANGVSKRLYGKLKKGYGEVLLDGKKTKLSTLLNKPQKVTLNLPDDRDEANVLVSFEPIKVIYEDANWLVVDKPAGLTSVPGPSNKKDTLVNRVKGYFKKHDQKIKAPKIITRLDRYTSGVVLFAKHSFGQSLIAPIVSSHMMDKRYLALVEGEIKKAHGFIEGPIKRSEDDLRYEVSPDGKEAKSEYWCLNSTQKFSLVQVKLHTGRTHQIRVHFKSIGHTLLGDKLYGGQTEKITRQALHAQKLGFVDPFTKKYLEFESPLPKDIKLIVENMDTKINEHKKFCYNKNIKL